MEAARFSGRGTVTRERSALDLVGLGPLMELTVGAREIVIGLVDGPVHPVRGDVMGEHVREIGARPGAGRCDRADSHACRHGTIVAGILSARRGGPAPAICPGCTLLARPIFAEFTGPSDPVPSARPEELAAAIVECVDAGARLVNLSAALEQPPPPRGERALQAALDHAAARGVILVAAAGNRGALGTTVVTRHPCAVPVVGCDRRGRPLGDSNLARSTARRGQLAPGEGVTSLDPDGRAVPAGGTSVAVPFVTGALALVWSEFPDADAARLRMALGRASQARRPTLVPPLLDAWAVYRAMRGLDPAGSTT